MSKFVTYPAVTVLDDDQSLLIDSPSAGTNSITAENAGNTLLSKWAGFETFDEAVQNTIENNQEFIDRDATIRSETAELKKKIVTTFPAKDASGAVATFESEFEDAPLKSCVVQIEPVQDLHGQDSPWPAGGGVNKWDEEWEVGAIDFDTGELVDSTTTIRSKNYIPVTGGGVYHFVFPNPNSNTMRIIQYDANKDYVRYSTANTSNGLTKTLAESTAYLKFYMGASYGSTYGNDIAINYPSTATSYAPYSNECPISGFTGCGVQRTGKNLFTRDGEIENSYVTRYGNISRDSGWILSDFIPVKGSTQYHFNPNSTEGGTAKHCCYNSQKQHIGYFNSGDVTFTTQADCAFMRFSYRSASENIQLEFGSTATPYAPYTGQTYPITFPSEAGTVYGGYVDVLNGELVVDGTMVDLGTFNPSVRYVGDINKTISITLPETYIGYGAFRGFFCSTYAVKGGVSSASDLKTPDDKDVGIYLYSNVTKPETKTVYFVMPKDLALNGELVFFATETQTYPLTPTEIKTLLGTNNIWSNTGDTTVEYLMSDVSWYVKKKLRAFQSILAGVEDSTSASKNYSANTYLIFNDNIYKTTKTITAGETIEEGVNVTKTTVAEQLMALAQA